MKTVPLNIAEHAPRLRAARSLVTMLNVRKNHDDYDDTHKSGEDWAKVVVALSLPVECRAGHRRWSRRALR